MLEDPDRLEYGVRSFQLDVERWVWYLAQLNFEGVVLCEIAVRAKGLSSEDSSNDAKKSIAFCISFMERFYY